MCRAFLDNYKNLKNAASIYHNRKMLLHTPHSRTLPLAAPNKTSPKPCGAAADPKENAASPLDFWISAAGTGPSGGGRTAYAGRRSGTTENGSQTRKRRGAEKFAGDREGWPLPCPMRWRKITFARRPRRGPPQTRPGRKGRNIRFRWPRSGRPAAQRWRCARQPRRRPDRGSSRQNSCRWRRR